MNSMKLSTSKSAPPVGRLLAILALAPATVLMGATLPAIARLGDIQVTVSTAGRSPAAEGRACKSPRQTLPRRPASTPT
mgnify:CR=1 FL=1